MSPHGTPDWEMLARFLAEESPPDETARVRAWLDAHPADAELVGALDGILDRVGNVATEEIDIEAALHRAALRRDAAGEGDVETALHRVSVHRNDSVRPRTRAPFRAPVPWWRHGALRAAALVGIIAAGTLLWNSVRRRPGQADGGPLRATLTRSYETAIGETDSVHLADGSLVVLGPRSRLEVAQGFGDPAREVTLAGEAFFDVRHDDAHAFTVHVGGAIIRDVGTSFSVRSEDGTGIRVAMRSGAVLFSPAGAPADRGVVLHDSDVGVLARDGGVVAQRGAASSDDFAWIAGRLVFREATMGEVRSELRRWYGVELRVADTSLESRHLTMTFTGEPLERVLQNVALALGARVEHRGDTAVIHAKGGPQ